MRKCDCNHGYLPGNQACPTCNPLLGDGGIVDNKEANKIKLARALQPFIEPGTDFKEYILRFKAFSTLGSSVVEDLELTLAGEAAPLSPVPE